MFKNITSVQIDVGVNEDSVLSPLLFAIVMNEITKNLREDSVKEIFYAMIWLVLLGDS